MNNDNLYLIGAQIKALRKEQQMTLQTLSEYTGLSVGFLSNVERDLTSPTLQNLASICEALNTTLNKLLVNKKEAHIVVRKKDTKVIEYPEYNQSITYIDFGITDEIFEIITIQPGKIKDHQNARHVYDENCTVLSGTLEIILGNQRYTLYEGDSIYIKKNTQHVIFNESDTPCVSYWVYHRKN